MSSLLCGDARVFAQQAFGFLQHVTSAFDLVAGTQDDACFNHPRNVSIRQIAAVYIQTLVQCEINRPSVWVI
jgi:hypothetical protein